jgi:hypothetical protein
MPRQYLVSGRDQCGYASLGRTVVQAFNAEQILAKEHR